MTRHLLGTILLLALCAPGLEAQAHEFETRQIADGTYQFRYGDRQQSMKLTAGKPTALFWPK